MPIMIPAPQQVDPSVIDKLRRIFQPIEEQAAQEAAAAKAKALAVPESQVVKRLRARLSVGGYPDVKLEFPEKKYSDTGWLGLYERGPNRISILANRLKNPEDANWILSHELAHREQSRRGGLSNLVKDVIEAFTAYGKQPSEHEANEAADYVRSVNESRARRGQGTLPARYILAGRLGTMGKK